MPYIDKEKRKEAFEPNNAGELNYLITLLCKDYLERKGERYSTLNELVGVLECAKLEFYRRVAVPYEDSKIEENGDVY